MFVIFLSCWSAVWFPLMSVCPGIHKCSLFFIFIRASNLFWIFIGNVPKLKIILYTKEYYLRVLKVTNKYYFIYTYIHLICLIILFNILESYYYNFVWSQRYYILFRKALPVVQKVYFIINYISVYYIIIYNILIILYVFFQNYSIIKKSFTFKFREWWHFFK